MMKNNRDVRNMYNDLKKISGKVVSIKGLPAAIRCHNKNRGKEINRVIASEVSSMRLVREGMEYVGCLAIQGSLLIDYPTTHDVYLPANFFFRRF